MNDSNTGADVIVTVEGDSVFGDAVTTEGRSWAKKLGKQERFAIAEGPEEFLNAFPDSLVLGVVDLDGVVRVISNSPHLH